MSEFTMTDLSSQMSRASLTRPGRMSDDTSSTSYSRHNTYTRSGNGWGSISSRKSYACLKSLNSDGGGLSTDGSESGRQFRCSPEIDRQRDSWGYFADISCGCLQI
uniref:Uncharacterized protein n=1 Tax=Ditylum brightwellii TaxID=49249 RepID=A0A6U3SA50_9STRA